MIEASYFNPTLVAFVIKRNRRTGEACKVRRHGMSQQFRMPDGDVCYTVAASIWQDDDRWPAWSASLEDLARSVWDQGTPPPALIVADGGPL